MSKEQVGLIVMLVGLLGTVLTAGIRVGTLTEQIQAQAKQLELLTAEMRAINQHFILYSLQHRSEEGR